MKENYFVTIMAGGIGSRFWPSSRVSLPKQFLDITGDGSSLLQKTVKRLEGIVLTENILIISNIVYADQIAEQLPELQPNQILLEPSRNNTAPCVAYTALHLNAKVKHPVFAMLPADHIIENTTVFRQALTKGFQKAEREDAIITLGIQPSRPDTGYGYIRFQQGGSKNDIYRVETFVEKPKLHVAEEYLKQGNYLWNAGIFIWSANTVLNAFQKTDSQILKILTQDVSKYNTAEEQDYINQVYPNTENISIDYAILEKAKNVYTIPVEMGWSDLGTWNSLYSFLKKDKSKNVTIAGESILEDVQGSLIKTNNSEKLIVVKGLKDYIVIDEGDVLLIYPRGDEQKIKELKNRLKNSKYE